MTDESDAPGLLKDDRGAAYAEFLIAFPPILLLFLAIMQLTLLYVGKLAVRHAATRAARAAIVVLPDDPEHYDGADVNQVDYDGGGSDAEGGGFLHDALGPLLGTAIGGEGDGRIRAVRRAAAMPLTPLGPSIDNAFNSENLIVEDALDRGIGTLIGSAALYNRGATAVTFHSPGENDFKRSFDNKEVFATRVTYLFHCGVPIVNDYICSEYLELALGNPLVLVEALGDRVWDGHEEWLGGVLDDFLGAEDVSQGVRELAMAEAPWMVLPFVFGKNRVVILRAQAILPNQGAGYDYE